MTSQTIFIRGTSGNTINITIYDSDGNEEVASTPMTEIGTTGLFRYVFTATGGRYAAIMDDATSGRSLGMKDIEFNTDIVKLIQANKLQIQDNILTIFEDDGSTVALQWDLKDGNGVPTQRNVLNRIPK